MPVITLTTEWKADDFYSGIIKGKLCSLCPGIVIIDNATGIPVFNISHASFVIRNTYNNYPPGSVHIICVHTEGNKEKGFLAVRAGEHYFIGTDNGIFNLILNHEPDEVVRIGNTGDTNELDIFAGAAAMLIKGRKLSEIGMPADHLNEKIPLRAAIEKDVITGSIIFIDSYGNAISNITREVFCRVFKDKKFRILVQSNRYRIDHISTRYDEEPVGELLARFNILDLLEVSINGANISELINLGAGSVIRVELARDEKILK
ncbi:MAG: SAM hydrolase/SAM-dependent halogenase family protein [Bacteroidales bacterium]